MRKPWTLTIVLGLLGLVAAPILVTGPVLIGEMRTESELRPLVLLLWVLIFLSLGWLVAFLWTIFQHRGRTRTILLACAALLITGFVVIQFGPRRNISISLDLPPPSQPAER